MIKTILIGGSKVDVLATRLDREKFEFVRRYSYIHEAVEELTSGGFIEFEKVLIVSKAITEDDDDIKQIRDIQEALYIGDYKADVYFVLGDKGLYDRLSLMSPTEIFPHVQTNIIYFEKILIKYLDEVLLGLMDKQGLFHPDFVSSVKLEKLEQDTDEEEEEKDPFDVKKEVYAPPTKEEGKREDVKSKVKERIKFNLTPKLTTKNQSNVATSSETLTKDNIFFRGILGVTGDRGSGVSTLAANLSEAMASLGLSVLLVDMDLIHKFQTVLHPYYSEELSSDERKKVGLYLLLNNYKLAPELITVTPKGVNIIGVGDEGDMPKIANKRRDELFNAQRIISLFGALKSQFDVIVIDLPMEQLKKVPEISSFVDRFILTIPNSTYALDYFLFNRLTELEDINNLSSTTLMNKAKIVLTKYNPNSKYQGVEFDEKAVSSLLFQTGISNFYIDVIGRVDLDISYENQIRSNNLLWTTDKHYRNLFSIILSNL